MRTLIVANDVMPGMGMPVAAPGLRAWGLGIGLSQHGHDVTFAVNRHVADNAWTASVPAPTRPGIATVLITDLGDVVRRHAPDVVVFTNSNVVEELPTDTSALMVYDFFAPKMLELAYEEGATWPRERLRALRERKIAGLQLADVVAVNGTKKLPYVYAWLLMCDRDVRSVPVETVWMGVPPLAPFDHGDDLRLTLAGYVQAWSQPGPWVEALLGVLDHAGVHLDVLIADHWGGRERPDLVAAYRRLLGHPGTTAHDVKPFDEFRQFLNTSDVALDLFAWNLEREYATVTRTIVALCSGVAVIHPPFTEVAPLIADYDAGWLIAPEDVDGLADLFATLRDDPELVARKRANAHRLATEVFAPGIATRTLNRRLRELAA